MLADFQKILNQVRKTYHYEGEYIISEEVWHKCLIYFKQYPHFLNIRYFLSNLKKDTILKLEKLIDDQSITRYVNYMHRLNSAGYVSNESYVRESWNYIQKYCKNRGISVHQYQTYEEKPGTVYEWLIHLKERRVSLYAMCFFPKISEKLLTLDREWYKYYVEDIEDFYKKKLEVESQINLTNKLKKLISY